MTGVMQPSTALGVCGTSPLSAQCSATVVQQHSDSSSLYTKWSSHVLLYCNKTVGLQHGEGERIGTYKNGVWSKAFSVENCNREDK